MVTKKRDGEGGRPAAARKAPAKKAAGTVGGTARKAPSRKASANVEETQGRERSARPASRSSTVKAAAKKGPARPKLRASHATAEAVGKRGEGERAKPARGAAAKGAKKLPLAAPKRAAARKPAPPDTAAAARELAVAIAGEGLEKKALGVEILDVCGRVDYADFLVIMTGRSDRHVHSIATGIEEALGKKRKASPISVEGLSAANWVLLDYGDVVVHVFQEEARQLYDIEGLWMDASRVAVPEGAAGGPSAHRVETSFADPGEVGEEPPESAG